MSYNETAFRLVKHGVEDKTAYCRHCEWSADGMNADKKARYHAKKTLHTVDIYRETHTEYTSYVKGSKKQEN